MLSDEEKEIFNNLKDYMQSEIDNGYHKFIYNDLDWDFKCIDCINAIDKVLKQSKEIEIINEILTWKQKHEEQLQKEIEELKYKYSDEKIRNTIIKRYREVIEKDYISKDKIKAKIEELEKLDFGTDLDFETDLVSQFTANLTTITILQSLLNEEE